MIAAMRSARAPRASGRSCRQTSRVDVPDAIARDDNGDVAGDAVGEAGVGDRRDRQMAVDDAIARETASPPLSARVVDEAADSAEPRILVGLCRLVVEGELLEGVRPDEQRPRVAAVRRDVLEQRDEDDVGDGAVRQPGADDVLP